MKNLRELSIYTALFIINPFITICFSLLNLFTGKKTLIKFFFFSFSISLVSIYYPPLFDSISNFWLYNTVKNLSFEKFMLIDFDKAFGLPFFLLSKINVQYYTVCFIYIFFITFLWFKCFYDIDNLNNKKSKNENIYFLIFLLAFSYRYPLDLMRFTLATIIFIYSFNNLLKFNQKKYLLILVFSCLIHFSLIFIIIISLINYLFIKKQLKQSKIILILVTILSFFITKFGNFILGMGILDERLSRKLKGYIVENTKGFSFIFNSGITGVITFIGIAIAFLITFYMFKKDNFRGKKLKKIYVVYKNNLIIFSWFYFFIFSNWLLNERFLFFFILLYINYLYLEYKITYNKISKLFLLIVLSLISLRTLALNYRYLNWSLDNNYKMIKNQEIKKNIILKSFVFNGIELLNIRKNGYSDSVFLQNTKIKEDFKYLKNKK